MFIITDEARLVNLELKRHEWVVDNAHLGGIPLSFIPVKTPGAIMKLGRRRTATLQKLMANDGDFEGWYLHAVGQENGSSCDVVFIKQKGAVENKTADLEKMRARLEALKIRKAAPPSYVAAGGQDKK